jgi:hypothetical protein
MQRLLAALVLGEVASGWNRRRPSERGADFLRSLHGRRFGETPTTSPDFVDEFELPARRPDERAGWPDHGVNWADRLHFIELKTERRSHHAGQLPYYLELARHHHPNMAIDLLYVTPTMTVAAPEPLPDRARYAWIPWTEVATLASDVRGSTTTWESGVWASPAYAELRIGGEAQSSPACRGGSNSASRAPRFLFVMANRSWHQRTPRGPRKRRRTRRTGLSMTPTPYSSPVPSNSTASNASSR